MNSSRKLAGHPRITSHLSSGAQLFVFSIRQWLLAATNKYCVHCELLAFYDRYEARPALPIFCELMSHLSVTATRPVLIDCPCNINLTDDEVVLLGAIQSIQRGDQGGARRSLEPFLTVYSAATFVRIASAYVAELQAVKLSLTGARFLETVPSPARPVRALH